MQLVVFLNIFTLIETIQRPDHIISNKVFNFDSFFPVPNIISINYGVVWIAETNMNFVVQNQDSGLDSMYIL